MKPQIREVSGTPLQYSCLENPMDGGAWVGYSPCSGSDTTECLPCHFSLSCTGEGNGNPLQCSCPDNPRDRGAYWAVVYGVTQSQTRLKCLSRKPSDGIFSLRQSFLFQVDKLSVYINKSKKKFTNVVCGASSVDVLNPYMLNVFEMEDWFQYDEEKL